MPTPEPKRHALIKGNKVVDLVIPGPGYSPPRNHAMVATETANIGDVFDKNTGLFSVYDPPASKEELREYAIYRQKATLDLDIEFNIADPGDDPKIVKFKNSPIIREEIRDLAWIAETTGENVTLVTTESLVLTLTPKQIMGLRLRMAEHIHRSHRIVAQVLEAIDKAQIPYKRLIDEPEKATAVKLDSWFKKYG